MAGFFGLFDYTKPGKGVEKDEPVKPRFKLFWELFIRKFWKLVQLNLIYLLFCLPVVTIGPATAGMTYVLRNFATERPVFMFSDFWDAFKGNFKQSFVYGLIIAVFAFVMSVSWDFYTKNLGVSAFMYVPVGLCGLLTLLFVFMAFYSFLMIVTIDLPLWGIIKNSLILSIACMKSNFITLFFVALVLLAIYLFFPYTVLVVIAIIPAMLGFIICFNAYPGIKKYVIDPYRAKQQKDEEPESPDDVIFSDKQKNQHLT